MENGIFPVSGQDWFKKESDYSRFGVSLLIIFETWTIIRVLPLFVILSSIKPIYQTLGQVLIFVVLILTLLCPNW